MKIDIPSIVGDTGSIVGEASNVSPSRAFASPPSVTTGSHSPFRGAVDVSGFRRRASIQLASSPSEQARSSPRYSGAQAIGVSNVEKNAKVTPPASALMGRYSSSMASAFLRRKQPYLSSELSDTRAPANTNSPSAQTASAVAENASTPRLFFQDNVASECESQDGSGECCRTSLDPSVEPIGATDDEVAATSAENEHLCRRTRKTSSETASRSPSAVVKAAAAASSPRRRDVSGKPSANDHTSTTHEQQQQWPPQAFERIGELSREEDEFDFAILLKPSKNEEHLEVPRATIASTSQVGAGASNALPSASGHIQLDSAVLDHSHLRGKPKKDPTRARNLIIERIRLTGLHVKRLLSLNGKQTLLKVKAPQHVLEAGAERLRLRKLRKFDRIWMEFSRELRTSFADFDEHLGGVRFIDSEKQSIVHALLTSATADNGAGLNEFCPLKIKYVVQMFPLHKQDLSALRTQWVTYWRPLRRPPRSHPLTQPSSLSTDTPISTRPEANEPQTHHSSCNRLVTGVLSQPIDDVAQYFGEKVAFYFAWMEMYTRWLLVPSIVGLVLFALQVSSKKIDHPLAPLYAVFIALWTSAFLIAWKRRASALAYRWGTLGYEEDTEVTRPEFYGDPALSTPERKQYPAWRRYAKYVVTIPTVFGSMALITLIAYMAFSTRDRLEHDSLETKTRAKHVARDIATDLEHGLTLQNLKQLSSLGLDWKFWFYFLITPLLYGLLIPVLDFAFTKWARVMANWENHETESRYRSHLILKVFSFRFVHVFASLYYYAFAGSRGDNLLRVAIQLASFMVAGQLWKNAMETLYPFVVRRWRARQKKRDTNAQFSHSAVFNATALPMGGSRRRRSDALVMAAHRSAAGGGVGGAIVEMTNTNAVIHEQCVRLEQASDKAWDEAELEPYDTFEDYTEMLIQFGYVSFFSLAFPLAPLLALINNVVELRTDAFKLCHAKQRPIAHKASGIGVWSHVLQLMSVLAVLTNCLHIAFTTTLLERLVAWSSSSAVETVTVTATTKVWVAFGAEHVLLAFQVAMMLAIPAMPRDVLQKVRVEREQAKQESARALAAKMLLLAATPICSDSGEDGGDDAERETTSRVLSQLQ